MRIEYDATRKKYLLDTEVTTRVTALAALRAKGLRWTKADLLLRLCKLAATLNRYFDALEREPMRRPQPDPISYEEFRSVFCNMLANALDRQLSLRKAERWVRECIRPGKKRVSCYGLKHTLDHWYQARGSACYLTERDFTDVLRHCGHIVKNGFVRIQELCD
jgi:hypothetical protein